MENKTLADWLAEPWSLRNWAELCNVGRAADAIADALKVDDIELSALGQDLWRGQQKVARRQRWLTHISDKTVAEALGLALKAEHPFAIWLEQSPLRQSASLSALVAEHFIRTRPKE